LDIIHFNNAGASLTNINSIQILKDYIDLEKNVGGYELQEKNKAKLNKFYEVISRLINCKPSEVSFMPNSTLSWNFAFNSIPITKYDDILIFENEYSSNLLTIIKKQNQFRNLKICKLNNLGEIDFSKLEQMITRKTRLININHVCSQNGDIMPVEIIGKILKNKNPNSIFMIDACQSAGQVPIDVKKFKCDILTTTGRKFLNGPRGTGFLYVNTKTRSILDPLFLDMTSAKLISDKKFRIKKNRPFLESFEFSPALQMAFTNSIKILLNRGIDNIMCKNIRLSKYLRKKLVHNVHFYENKNNLSAINTFSLKKGCEVDLFNYLKKNKINTYLVNKDVSNLYFKKIKKKFLLRISFHYYNNKKEIDYFAAVFEKFNKIKKMV